MTYPVHPDFAGLRFAPPLSPVLLRLASPMLRGVVRAMRVPRELCASRFRLSGHRGLKTPVEVYRPRGENGPLPCLLYLHGGAFCSPAAPCHKRLALRYAREARLAVAFLDYHLLPAHPFPAARDDAVAAFDWLCAHAGALGVDGARLAVGGDSAGAALAAEVCAHAAGRLRFQLLIYPALDVRMQTESMRRYGDTPMWNARLNQRMWRMYLKGTPQARWEEASPMQAPLPPTLPDTYIETAEFDCLHDEGVAYAQRLREAGASVTLYEAKGTLHGYDMRLSSPVTERSVRRRVEALRSHLWG